MELLRVTSVWVVVAKMIMAAGQRDDANAAVNAKRLGNCAAAGGWNLCVLCVCSR